MQDIHFQNDLEALCAANKNYPQYNAEWWDHCKLSFNNLHFLRNVFDYCKARKLPCIALCFDQAKAFDSVDHHYLHYILKQLGIGPNVRAFIKLLYTDIYSTVLINGFFTDLFEVTRSMRQGCGLSPMLYASCTEPLINKIRDSLLFKGIPMPTCPPHGS